MIIWIPLFVALVGALVYLLSKHQKAVELGRISYWCGLLVTLYEIGTRVLHIP